MNLNKSHAKSKKKNKSYIKMVCIYMYMQMTRLYNVIAVVMFHFLSGYPIIHRVEGLFYYTQHPILSIFQS